MAEETVEETAGTETTETVETAEPEAELSVDELKKLLDRERADRKKFEAKASEYGKESATRRKQLEELQRKGETEIEAKVREARESAAAERDGKWKPLFVQSKVEAALQSAGVVGDVDRVTPLVRIADLDVDEDGRVTGLDEQIRDVKKRYPEFFAKAGSRQVDGASRGAQNGGISGADQTSDLIIQQLRGGSR